MRGRNRRPDSFSSTNVLPKSNRTSWVIWNKLIAITAHNYIHLCCPSGPWTAHQSAYGTWKSYKDLSSLLVYDQNDNHTWNCYRKDDIRSLDQENVQFYPSLTDRPTDTGVFSNDMKFCGTLNTSPTVPIKTPPILADWSSMLEAKPKWIRDLLHDGLKQRLPSLLSPMALPKTHTWHLDG